MQPSFLQIKEKELRHLAEERKRYPELFKLEPLIDDQDLLSSIGIINIFKERPLGYLRLWPQDFIVEEVSQKDGLQTVESEPFFKEGERFSKTDPTCYATLVKCGLSTIEAQEILAANLGIEKKAISFAGIKDKDTISSQLISFRGADIEKLEKFKLPNLFLKNVYTGKGIVETGSLEGNRFTILVRTEKDFDREEFLTQLKKIEKEGFWNFFYLQRFGTPRLINFHWGRLILQGNYEKAIFNFLTEPGKRELSYFRGLRQVLKKEWPNFLKISKLLSPFPLIFFNEHKVINYLLKNPRDFIGALKEIPEQTQLWVFAYGSYLFNKKLSQLILEGSRVPETLPLILSKKREDWLIYQDFLREDKIREPLRALRPFPFIQWAERVIKTKEEVQVQKVKIIPQGVAFCFFLPKACYATTFLSHLFTLASGVIVPEGISQEQVHIKDILGIGNLKPVLKRFREVIRCKSEDILKRFE